MLRAIVRLADQPRILRENRSRIMAKYSQPSPVQIYVRSAHQAASADSFWIGFGFGFDRFLNYEQLDKYG